MKIFGGKKRKGFFGKPYKKPKSRPRADMTKTKIGGQKVFQRPAKVSSGKKSAKYKYSIVQSKDQRVSTYNTREEAIMALNKKRESMPGFKYRIVAERQPENKLGW